MVCIELYNIEHVSCLLLCSIMCCISLAWFLLLCIVMSDNKSTFAMSVEGEQDIKLYKVPVVFEQLVDEISLAIMTKEPAIIKELV